MDRADGRECVKCGTWKSERKFRSTHRACRKCNAFSDRARKFGITEEQLMEYVNHPCCDICGDDFSNSKLCVDHDHRTGKIRGVLCNHCNTALGLFKDKIVNLSIAINYLNG